MILLVAIIIIKKIVNLFMAIAIIQSSIATKSVGRIYPFDVMFKTWKLRALINHSCCFPSHSHFLVFSLFILSYYTIFIAIIAVILYDKNLGCYNNTSNNI